MRRLGFHPAIRSPVIGSVLVGEDRAAVRVAAALLVLGSRGLSIR